MPAANSKDAIDSLRDAEVLVVAPRFPSINQPWMDTYLEQLQSNGIRFCVATAIKNPSHYHQKVDRLGLLRRSITFSLDAGEVLSSSARQLATHPVNTSRGFLGARRGLAGITSGKKRLSLALRNLHVIRTCQDLPALRVIHLHAIAFGFHFISLADQRDLPVVLTFHGLMPRGVPQVSARRRQALFDCANVVLVNTEYASRQAQALGCPESKLEVLPQGLPLEDFPFVPRPPPVDGEPLTLLTVGRFHRDKGQGYCLLALRRLLDSGINAHWTFIGVGPDKHFLVTLAAKLGVDHKVSFEEGISPLPHYQRCHLFVLPSVDHIDMEHHVETQGVVLQEAQASGCIPIATRVGGIPECINDGSDGVLVKDRSHRAIAAAIQDLLARPGAWSELQRRGRENVEQNFSADVIGVEMAKLLRKAMSGRAAT